MAVSCGMPLVTNEKEKMEKAHPITSAAAANAEDGQGRHPRLLLLFFLFFVFTPNSGRRRNYRITLAG